MSATMDYKVYRRRHKSVILCRVESKFTNMNNRSMIRKMRAQTVHQHRAGPKDTRR